MSVTVASQLEARIATGEVQPDSAQREAAQRLDALILSLKQWRLPRSSFLGGLLGRGKRADRTPRGLYIHGSVGRGKTMLMDLFYAAAPVERKWRIHFHEFMAEVHDRIGEARNSSQADPIAPVARQIADKAHLLCFDEFHVTDIADAMILGRLFTALFAHGVVVVATSNVTPDGLYTNGLNRQLFVPFIELLKTKVDVLELKSAKDFRLEKLAGQPLYFSPLDARADAALDAAFHRVSGVAKGAPETLDVKGRTLRVSEAASGVARFTFEELCMRPLGTLDYLHIAHAYHTVILKNVPKLNRERRAEARRFINLIDTLYDAGAGLIVSAETEPDDIYPRGDEAFLFERTASRLMEMRSAEYLETRGRKAAELPASVPAST